jgi:hypothetical protein
MNTMVRRSIVCIAAFALTCALRCSISPVAGGASSSENTRIAGIILDTLGVPAPGTNVMLIPEEYNPVEDARLPDSQVTVTDSHGRYSFDIKASGIFNVQAAHPLTGTRLLRQNIVAGLGDMIDSLVDILRPAGAIEVRLPDSVDMRKGFVYIRGTDIFTFISSRSVRLDSVPVGTDIKIFYTNIESDVCLTNTIQVVPGGISISASVLLIVSSTAGAAGKASDQLVYEKLHGFGHRVAIKDETGITRADTAGVDLIIVTTTITREDILGVLRDVRTPVLNMEYNFLYGMAMIADSVFTVNWGRIDNIGSYDLVNASHPAAGGLSGRVAVFSQPTRINWGRPVAGAALIAAVPGQPEKSPIFCYEKGSEMAGMVAPAKRGALLTWSFHTQLINENGWRLFENMVKWLLK